MKRWLASNHASFQIETKESFTIPRHWLWERTELARFLGVGHNCVGLYECCFYAITGEYGHRVAAYFSPGPDSNRQEPTPEMVEALFEGLREEIRARMSSSEHEDTTQDENGVVTEWHPPDSSYFVNVGREWFKFPSIQIYERIPHRIDFDSLISSSPLMELTALSPEAWDVHHVSYGVFTGEQPSMTVSAKDGDSDLFVMRLSDLGYECRKGAWWKEQMAIQPMSNGSWMASLCAPSFVPGFGM